MKMKTLRNENGYVIVLAILILSILTIIGVSALQTSRTEVQISTNSLIYHKNFYAAESAAILSFDWLRGNLDESDYLDIDYIGEYQKSDFEFPVNSFRNMNFWAEVIHKTAIDPLDGVEKVVLFGDADGDYLNESNFTTGVPFEIVTGYGTHVRGGQSAVQIRLKYEPIFMMPNAALRVNSSVDGNGISGSILGESRSGSECGNVADIMYDVGGGTIEYAGDLGATARIEQSTGMYPLPLLKDTIIKKATLTLPGSNNIDESSIITTAENPGIIYLDANSKATNLTGYGILFVDGDLDLAGNLNWTGIILVSGNMVFSGGGTKTIYGAIVGMGEAIAINGSVDIQYDCDVLSALHDDFSGYKMTSWKQI
jgi:hypothetical protein